MRRDTEISLFRCSDFSTIALLPSLFNAPSLWIWRIEVLGSGRHQYIEGVRRLEGVRRFFILKYTTVEGV